MYVLHALNIGLPILTIPFLTRNLGSALYGVYGLLLSLVAISVIVIEYGYGILGTKLLSAAGSRPAGQVLGEVLARQISHAVLGLPLMLAAMAALAFKGYPIDTGAIVLTLLIALLSAISPLWFYVAQSGVAALMMPTIASKLGFLLLVALGLPRLPTVEFALFAYLVSCLWVVPALWPNRQAIVSSLRMPGPLQWLKSSRTHSAIPLQRLGTTLYTQVPTLLVAAWFGLQSAGLYFLADRIVRGVVGLYVPLTSHLLPMQLELEQASATAPGQRRLRMLVAMVMMAALTGTVVLVIGAPWLTRLLGGAQFADTAPLLAWLAPLTFLSTANTLLMNKLYGCNAETLITKVVWAAGTVYLVTLLAIGRRSIEVFAGLCMAVEILELSGMLLASRRAQQPR
jgi:PST family polysaccharide transporter